MSILTGGGISQGYKPSRGGAYAKDDELVFYARLTFAAVVGVAALALFLLYRIARAPSDYPRAPSLNAEQSAKLDRLTDRIIAQRKERERLAADEAANAKRK